MARRYLAGLRLVHQEVVGKDKDIVWAYHRDELTGLLNRETVYEFGERALRDAIRRKTNLSVVYIDLDNLKQYNDDSGHDEGDRILSLLGKAITASLVRPWDLAGRIGGDEFLLVLPDTEIVGAHAVVDRLRHAIRFPFSAGVYTQLLRGDWREQMSTVTLDLFKTHAEAEMYLDKKSKDRHGAPAA